MLHPGTNGFWDKWRGSHHRNALTLSLNEWGEADLRNLQSWYHSCLHTKRVWVLSLLSDRYLHPIDKGVRLMTLHLIALLRVKALRVLFSNQQGASSQVCMAPEAGPEVVGPRVKSGRIKRSYLLLLLMSPIHPIISHYISY